MLEIDKITAWIAEAFDVVKYNFSALVLLSFCVTLCSLLSIGLLAGPLFCGLLIIIFKLIEDRRKGVVATPTHPRDLIKGFDFFTQSLMVSSLFIAVFILQAVFFSITHTDLGIIWSFVFFALNTLTMFALPLIVTRNYSALEAVKASYDVTSKNPLTFGALVLVFYVALFVSTYLINTIFGGIVLFRQLLDLAVSTVLISLLATSIAIAHLEVFKEK